MLKKQRNRFSAMNGFWKKKAVSSRFPVVMNIEVSNHCNFSCTMCPINKQTRPRGFMSFGLWKKIVDEVCEFTDLIIPSFMGEPLMHPEIVKFVEYAKSKGIAIDLVTNVSLLDKDTARSLFKSGLNKLVLCIDGTTRETYESIRVGGSFAKVLSNAKRAISLHREMGSKTKVIVQLIELEQNQHQCREFVDYWKKTGATPRIKRFQSWGGKVGRKLPSKAVSPCDYLWRVMVVGWNGKVFACCRDCNGEHVVGDTSTESVSSVWNGSKMRALRLIHVGRRRNSLPLCRFCEHETSPFIIAHAFFNDSFLENFL